MTEPATPPSGPGAPGGPVPGRPAPDGHAPGGAAPRRDRAWPWLLVLVLAVAAGVLLAWRPWAPAPQPRDEGPAATATPTDTGAATPSPTAPSAPAADETAFDAGSAPALFLTVDELAAAVPLAAGQFLADAEEARWGLPERSTVDPSSCTPAVTTTSHEPDVFLLRFASGDAVTVVQSVLVLPDAAAARTAFDELVGTLEDCPAYQQTNPGTDGGAWTAEPPETEDGAVPTVVRRLTLAAEGATSPEVEVTALAGNALVTTTASGVDPATEPADAATLVEVSRSSAQRALAGLG
ncbi:sensor domain-containing protein [Cellulomonas sp. ACRRI]|uniref:sensor domain-containing protein n=1 Tax=Cellulomonas sp. ACRRI TaxID=2918188 RepID=UPI001EF3C68E|nr:sensor domain-containing protein [Cellulomonas sp. ACRRI]MCG7285064.1 sensor domain-containing protein [Cellulomonas sp. ACRRI]